MKPTTSNIIYAALAAGVLTAFLMHPMKPPKEIYIHNSTTQPNQAITNTINNLPVFTPYHCEEVSGLVIASSKEGSLARLTKVSSQGYWVSSNTAELYSKTNNDVKYVTVVSKCKEEGK